jgi:DNA-binding PadR family transcriptional regulator
MSPHGIDTPLFKSGLHVLLALADGDRHGYAIKQEVERLTAGDVRLGPGTLYEAIQRLEQRGLIAESGERPDTDDRADRRYYRLTPAGRAVLKAELRRAARLVEYGRLHRLLGPEKTR